MKQLDEHGQPLGAFNYKRNRDKLLNNLVGILNGVVADSRIDEQEVLYLDVWLKDAKQLDDNWAFSKLCDHIEEVLADGVITSEELEHLSKLLPQFIEALTELPGVDFYSQESDKSLLEGLCKGVLANPELNDQEVAYLKWWLSVNGMLKTTFPGKELYQLVSDILADGRVSDDERRQLREAIDLYIGKPMAEGVADGMATLLPLTPNPVIQLQGSTICFTGRFLSGTRKKCHEVAEMLGAEPRERIVRELDYLVIGTLSSRDWRFSNHGRKIEKAVDYRDRHNTGLQILNEEQWLAHTKTLIG
jgi:NAD-dependent DNA ligase